MRKDPSESDKDGLGPAFDEKGGSGMITDIAGRKNTQRTLQKIHNELEIKVKERTAELSSAIELLEEEVAKREKAEEELRKSKLWMTSIYDSLEEAVLVVTPDKGLKNVNKSAEKMFGYSEKELLEQSTEILHVDHEHYLEFGQKLKRVFNKGEAAVFEFQARRKNGEIFPTEHTVSVIKDKSGKLMGIVSIVRDITERRKAEKSLNEAYNRLKETQEQLIQSTKMAVMGQVASGISHELNQPLTGVKGFAQAMQMDLDKGSPLHEDINRILKQTDRMEKIINNVRSFAKKAKYIIEEMNINKSIEDSLKLLDHQLTMRNIQVKKSLAKNLPEIQGDSNQLEQVFINLITNARDAIESLKDRKGGEILIKTALSKDKKHIEIIFKDTGCGIPPEKLEHIFEPFFTTKSGDAGLGLGMSIVKGIIEKHKGNIKITGKVGKGTEVRIQLPIKEVASRG